MVLTESYNTRIDSKNVADQYEVPLGIDLGIPIVISKNGLVPKVSFILLAEEKEKVKEAQRNFVRDLEILDSPI
jgi:malate/lactate dehydrogenase